MLHEYLSNAVSSPRDRLLCGVGIALVVAQLAAFWMICSDQVHKAQDRDATSQAQRVAAQAR